MLYIYLQKAGIYSNWNDILLIIRYRHLDRLIEAACVILHMYRKQSLIDHIIDTYDLLDKPSFRNRPFMIYNLYNVNHIDRAESLNSMIRANHYSSYIGFLTYPMLKDITIERDNALYYLLHGYSVNTLITKVSYDLYLPFILGTDVLSQVLTRIGTIHDEEQRILMEHILYGTLFHTGDTLRWIGEVARQQNLSLDLYTISDRGVRRYTNPIVFMYLHEYWIPTIERYLHEEDIPEIYKMIIRRYIRV